MSTEMPSMATVPSTTLRSIRTRTAWKLLSAARTSHMRGLGGTWNPGGDDEFYPRSTRRANAPKRPGTEICRDGQTWGPRVADVRRAVVQRAQNFAAPSGHAVEQQVSRQGGPEGR